MSANNRETISSGNGGGGADRAAPLSTAAPAAPSSSPASAGAASVGSIAVRPATSTPSTVPASEPQGSLSAAALEAIEQRYVEVLRALSAEPQLEPFRNEYEKLHRLLLSSHDGEQRLLRQAHELREELDTHQQKIHTAMQLSQEDEEAIRVLRSEIETAWGRADAAHEQEQRSRELVHSLRQQVAELDSQVEKTAGLSMGQEAYLRDLLTVKKDREEEAVVLHATLNRTEAEHRLATAQMKEAEEIGLAATQELETQRRAYQQLLTNLETEQRERASKEASVRQYRETTEKCVRQLEEHNSQVERASKEEKKAGKDVSTLAQDVQTLARQVQERQERFAAEAARLAAAERDNTILANEIPQRQATLREHQDELKREDKKLKRMEKSARAQQADLAALVEKRAAAAEAVQKRSAAVEAAVAQLAGEEKGQKELEDAVAQAMQRKSRTVAANTSKATSRVQVEGQRVMEAGKRRRLEQQVEQLRTENEAMRKSTYYAEQNREKDTKAAQQALLSYHRTLDAIRARRTEAKSIEEDIALHQKKLKAQQELLNAVTADRQKTEKLLRETEEELRQLRARHGSKKGELEGVKSDLIQQEAELCQLHGLTRQLAKDLANTEQRLRFLREDRQHAESRVDALRNEAQQLRQVIAACDEEAQQQGARLTVMTRERNTLAAQLLHRTEELGLVREKLQLIEAARTAGEDRYTHTMQQLTSARDALLEQRLRCRLALVRLRYLDRLHRKEAQQERLMTQSRARVRALADELSTKHNTHTWRSLEGNAPEVLDGLAKVQLLQTKLLRKRDELQAKADQVEQTEKEYRRLRQQLARLPGPEAAEELALCSENMQQRKAQLVDMAESLSKAEEDAEALEVQMEQLQEELQDTKHKYYQEKMKHDALKRQKRLNTQTWGGTTVQEAGGGLSRGRPTAGRQRASRRGSHSSSLDVAGSQHSTQPLPASSSFMSASAAAATSNANAPAAASPSANASGDVHSRSTARRTGGGGAAGAGGGSHTQRRQRAAQEEMLNATLTAGPPQPSFPLQKPPHQRQFVGGGFSLTR